MEVYQNLDKKAIRIMQINALIILIIGLIILYFVYQEVSNNKFDQSYYAIIINVAFIVVIINLVLNVILYPYIRYKRYKYLIATDMIDIKKGLFIIKRTILPIERVQKIEISHGPIDRMFKLANVDIYTAAGIASIKFLNESDATKITLEIKKLLKEKIGN